MKLTHGQVLFKNIEPKFSVDKTYSLCTGHSWQNIVSGCVCCHISPVKTSSLVCHHLQLKFILLNRYFRTKQNRQTENSSVGQFNLLSKTKTQMHGNLTRKSFCVTLIDFLTLIKRVIQFLKKGDLFLRSLSLSLSLKNHCYHT